MKPLLARLTLVCVALVFISLILGSGSDAKIDPETCDGMWLFDDGGGTVAMDFSEKGNDGTLKNGPKWVDGKYGKALVFDGSKQQYMTTDASTMMDPYPYTFTAWVKLDEYNPDGNTGAVVMGNYTGDLKGSIFYISNTGMLSIRPHPGADLKGKTKILTGEWTHIATTLEGSDLKVYVNGEEDGSGVSAGYAGGLSKPFVIGKASWYDGSFFSGIIDEAALFNKALTEGKIRDVMTRGLLGGAEVSSKGKLAATWAAIKMH
jgi:hypothetical protein